MGLGLMELSMEWGFNIGKRRGRRGKESGEMTSGFSGLTNQPNIMEKTTKCYLVELG